MSNTTTCAAHLIYSSNLSVNNTILTSTEGSMQGDPLAKAMYGIGIISLIELLQNPNVTINGTQMMYALESLRAIIDNLDVRGKVFGYNVKPSNFQFIKKRKLSGKFPKSF